MFASCLEKKKGVDAHAAPLEERVGGLLDAGVAASAVPDEHADPVEVLRLQVEGGVVDGLAGGGDHELGEAAHAAGGLAVHEVGGNELGDLAGELAGKPGRVEKRDVIDAGATGEHVVPEFGHARARRGHRSKARHDNAGTRAQQLVHCR